MSVADLPQRAIGIATTATNVVICGSFRRDPTLLKSEYDSLLSSGCLILSPLDLSFTDEKLRRDRPFYDALGIFAEVITAFEVSSPIRFFLCPERKLSSTRTVVPVP